MFANASHDILQLAALGCVIENVIDGNQRNEEHRGNIGQTRETSRVVAAIEHAGRKPNRAWRSFLQPERASAAKPLGIEFAPAA